MWAWAVGYVHESSGVVVFLPLTAAGASSGDNEAIIIIHIADPVLTLGLLPLLIIVVAAVRAAHRNT